jgi:hypothetical protein
MPLTHAERQKRYREKQKEKYGENEIKEKESKRRKEKRQQNIELNREKDRMRKQKSRLNKEAGMATQKVIQRKLSITNAASFYEAIKGESIVKVLLITAEEIRNVVETNLRTVISAAPALPGIFSAHHFQHTDGKTNLKPYSTATYNVNQLGKTSNPCIGGSSSADSSEDIATSQVEDVKNGSFVIVTYDFASGSSSNKYVTKRLVALVTSSNEDESTVEVQYATAISKRRVKITSADKGRIEIKDIVQLLPCPALKRGVYEFEEDLDIDIF